MSIDDGTCDIHGSEHPGHLCPNQAESAKCIKVQRIIVDKVKVLVPFIGARIVDQAEWREIFGKQRNMHLALRHVRGCDVCNRDVGVGARVITYAMLELVRDYVNQTLNLDLRAEELFSDLVAAAE